MAYTLITPGMTGSALMTAMNAVIGDFDLQQAKRKWQGRKMVCLGDSIWNQSTLQPELIRLLGVTYNATEMTTGTGGYKPTAYPGSGFIAYSDAPGVGDNSIYKRADDVYRYSPELILICGGTNDNAISEPSWHYTYDYTDAVYTGATFTITGYAGTPSYISCLKGTLKKLVETNPAAKIIMTGRFEYETSKSSEADYAKLVARSNADRYCCQWAGVEFIDALNLGISAYNATTMLSGSAHPNTAGGVLMAHAFAKVASML